MPIAIKGAVTQPTTIRRTIPQFMPRPPFIKPIPKIAPITACELDTGTKGIVGNGEFSNQLCKVTEEKSNNTTDWANTTTRATIGDIFIKLLPTVIMAFLE